jgi:hypothetical protein
MCPRVAVECRTRQPGLINGGNAGGQASRRSITGRLTVTVCTLIDPNRSWITRPGGTAPTSEPMWSYTPPVQSMRGRRHALAGAGRSDCAVARRSGRADCAARSRHKSGTNTRARPSSMCATRGPLRSAGRCVCHPLAGHAARASRAVPRCTAWAFEQTRRCRRRRSAAWPRTPPAARLTRLPGRLNAA